MNSNLVIRSPRLAAVEVSWFSALRADEYEFLGVPDVRLRSSWEHCRDLVLTATSRLQQRAVAERLRAGSGHSADTSRR